MAGSAVNTQVINTNIFSVATHLGDEYAWMKKQAIEWHTALGTVDATMAATLNLCGFTTVADQQAIMQVVRDVDTLVATIEGTNSTTYVARYMVPDWAAVQGVS